MVDGSVVGRLITIPDLSGFIWFATLNQDRDSRIPMHTMNLDSSQSYWISLTSVTKQKESILTRIRKLSRNIDSVYQFPHSYIPHALSSI